MRIKQNTTQKALRIWYEYFWDILSKINIYQYIL